MMSIGNREVIEKMLKFLMAPILLIFTRKFKFAKFITKAWLFLRMFMAKKGKRMT